jgi:large subunit ribosomal protein L17
MRHRKLDKKLGRSTAHREALVASLVSSLILEKRIRTTVSKAKVAQRAAERLVTVARTGTLAARRRVIAQLRRPSVAKELIEKIVPSLGNRMSGCTRVTRIGRREGDNAELAFLEWVDIIAPDKRKKPATEEQQKKS